MTVAATQSWLILARSAPYGGHQARAGLDVALTAAAFEQDVTVVFLDAGVYQLLGDQDTGRYGLKNIGNMIPALALYDVKRICVHGESLAALGFSPAKLAGDVEPVGNDELKRLLEAADQVMVF